jgi:hypothetical protein
MMLDGAASVLAVWKKPEFTPELLTVLDATSAETIVPIDAEFERVSVPDNATNATRRFGRVIVVQE